MINGFYDRKPGEAFVAPPERGDAVACDLTIPLLPGSVRYQPPAEREPKPEPVPGFPVEIPYFPEV